MRMADLVGGGAPLLGEPPPIELANTSYARRGRPRDGLQTIEHLAAWLRDMRPRLAFELTDDDLLSVTAADLADARELRDAIRAVAAATVTRDDPDPGATATLNHHVRRTPRWRELLMTPEPTAPLRSGGRPVTTALATIAEEAVDLFAGPHRHNVRACEGPGCILHFVCDTARREWCSTGCGNRARAARHYAKNRRSPTPSESAAARPRA
jgi:predicted RNA-binding Zn ribbon-like protein